MQACAGWVAYFLCIGSLLICLDSQGPTMVFLTCVWRHDSLSRSSIFGSRNWAIKLPEQFLSVAAYITYSGWYRPLLLLGLISADMWTCKASVAYSFLHGSRTVTGLLIVVFGCWKEEQATKLCPVIQRLFSSWKEKIYKRFPLKKKKIWPTF